MPIHVLFVCLGNICRSPAAQGVFEKLIQAAGLETQITVDSCGTAAFNIGKSPDSRSISAAKKRGYAIEQQIARQIDDTDYERAHYVVAMDRMNLTNVSAWAPPSYQGAGNSQVPDPYYDDENAFDQAIGQIEIAAQGLFKYICEKHALRAIN